MFLRRLNLAEARDQTIATDLFLASPGYEFDTFGRLPSGDMTTPLDLRFPPTTAPEHRLTLAAFDRDQPVSLIQIALHMPTDDCAAILLLLVPPAGRRQHIGCEVVERLSRQARRWPGIHNWYLCVTRNNAAGLAFWRHCGFRTSSVGHAVPDIGEPLHVMRRAVKLRPLCQRHGAAESEEAVEARHLFARLD